MGNVNLSVMQIAMVALILIASGVVGFFEIKKATGHRFPLIQTSILLSVMMLLISVLLNVLNDK